MFTFFLTILLHKISKSSYFYQAEILHSCGKFKKSTGSQSLSIVAPRMANISSFENLWNLWGGTLSYALFGCLTVLIKALLQWVKEGWGYKNCTNVNSLSLKQSYWTFSFRITQFLYQKATLSPILLRTLTKAALIVGRAKITNSTFIQS